MFQSTHPRRVWRWSTHLSVWATRFQSTHPRRVWQFLLRLLQLQVCFNPHTHEGCDCKNPHLVNAAKQFQSTHPRRVWLLIFNVTLWCKRFQSTHPRRVWLCMCVYLIYRGFNPHTHEGCDSVNYDYEDDLWKFQSTHPRRVWRKGKWNKLSL